MNDTTMMSTPDRPHATEAPADEPAEPPSSDSGLVVLDPAGLLSIPELGFLQQGLARLAAELDVPCARCTIEVVDDRRMILLHQRWMDDPTPTDVLSFPMSHPGAPLDGDLAICLPEAERRCAEFAHDRIHELLLYALHGLLHLAGHEDSTEEGFARMHAEEDRLLEQAGFGRLFDPRDPGSGGDRS